MKKKLFEASVFRSWKPKTLSHPCLSTSLASTYGVIFSKKQDTVINSTEEETRYSRAYVTELALQYREEEFISRIQLKESGIQFQVGFSTDVSESCIWVSPFIKPGIPNDMSDLRFVKIRKIDFFNLSEFFYLSNFFWLYSIITFKW